MADMGKMMDMMQGMDFPVTKQEIMDAMMDKGADDETMDMVRNLPDREYSDMEDLRNEMTGMM